MFIVGLSVLLYPSLSAYINSKHASQVISAYSESVGDVSEKNEENFFNEANDYNRRLNEEPMAFFKPDLVSGYDQVLDITGTEIMGYIDIDKLNVELPIYHGVSQEVLQIGAGHLQGTSLPVGGDSTHCVLSGHRGLPSAKLFTDLNEMEIGDRFTITILNRTMTYEVDQIKVVLPTDTKDLQVVKGKDYCTLLTCTPYGINSHRLLVRGVRADDVGYVKKAGIFVNNEAFMIHPMIVMPVIAIPLLIIALIFVFIHDKRSRSDNKNENHQL